MTKAVRFLCLFVCFSFLWEFVSAQTSPTERKTDSMARLAVRYMNENKPDSVYLLAGDQMKLQINAQLWNNVYKNNLLPLLPFTKITFINSRDGVNKYRADGKVPIAFYTGLDDRGKLKDFLFQPWKDEPVAAPMTEAEQKTDRIARKIIAFTNAKQVDSIYYYAGEAFKKQLSLEALKSIAEKNIYPLTPFPEPIFTGSKNGVSKYKTGEFQMLIRLDEQGKYDLLLFQPYRDETLKTGKVTSDNPLKSRLDSSVDKVLSPYIQTKGNAGLSAGIRYKGKDYFYNYGDVKAGSGMLPGNHTLYEIGSITKTFTATLFALAVVQGKVKPDQSITAFLPDSVASNSALKNIMLKQLANHTSGLPRLPSNMQATITDPLQPYEHYDLKHMFSFLKSFSPSRKPGANYEYSNFGFGLLGVILERVYGKTYADLIAMYITGPSGLEHTKISLSDAELKKLSQGYNEEEKPVPAWELNSVRAAGALKSDSYDLLRYAVLQLQPPAGVLGKAILMTHNVSYTDESNVVGLGWHFLKDDLKVVQHSGGTGGYRSFVSADTANKIAVAVLTNNASNGDELGLRLSRALQSLSK